MSTPEDEPSKANRPSVKVVGPCKSGKSTLVAGLQAAGYPARSCSQEHSHVPAMWRKIDLADVLVYLDISLEGIQARSERSDWTAGLLAIQHQRLADARAHCDLYLQTDGLTPDQVLAAALRHLAAIG